MVRDTSAHVALELANHTDPAPTAESTRLPATFARTSWNNRSLRGVSQAGFVNNLNDGLTWGVFPLLFTDYGLGLAAVGLIKGLYPILRGVRQIFTGHLADTLGRKPLIVAGMLVQASGFVLALTLLEWPLLSPPPWSPPSPVSWPPDGSPRRNRRQRPTSPISGQTRSPPQSPIPQRPVASSPDAPTPFSVASPAMTPILTESGARSACLFALGQPECSEVLVAAAVDELIEALLAHALDGCSGAVA